MARNSKGWIDGNAMTAGRLKRVTLQCDLRSMVESIESHGSPPKARNVTLSMSQRNFATGNKVLGLGTETEGPNWNLEESRVGVINVRL